MNRFLILTLLLLSSFSLSAQEKEQKDDWVKIHMAGLSYGYSHKTLEETIDNDTENLKYSVNSIGLNYSSFSGDRLGFLSDAALLFPITTKYGSDSAKSNGGFTLDYLGSVGWRLEYKPFTVIPYVGFQADYGFISKDPVDDNKSNHMISLGLGTGVKGIYETAEDKGIFMGIRMTYNSLEFSSADYDSREIQLKHKFTLLLNAGYSWRSK